MYTCSFLKCVDFSGKKINPCLYCSSNRVIIHGSDAAKIPQLLKNFYKLNQTNLNQKNYADCLTTATSSCSKIKKKIRCVSSQSYFFNKATLFFSLQDITTLHLSICYFFFLKNVSR